MVLASRLGLEGLSLGVLASSLELSKSGLYAHFRSKDALLLAVLEHTKSRHLEHATPYLVGRTEGLDALRAYLTAWLDWIALPDLPAGCPILGASFEVEALDGPTHDYVVELTRASRARLALFIRRAVQSEELRADTPVEQVEFELRGISLSFHLQHRLLKDPEARARAERAIESLFERYGRTKGE